MLFDIVENTLNWRSAGSLKLGSLCSSITSMEDSNYTTVEIDNRRSRITFCGKYIGVGYVDDTKFFGNGIPILDIRFNVIQ